MEWQPINFLFQTETIGYDGYTGEIYINPLLDELVLLYSPRYTSLFVGFCYNRNDQKFMAVPLNGNNFFNHAQIIYPSHFMPLPEPPKER